MRVSSFDFDGLQVSPPAIMSGLDFTGMRV